MDSQLKQRIIDALKLKLKALDCPMCHSHKFTIMDGLVVPMLQADMKSIKINNGMAMPLVALVCNHCGFVSYHNLLALDIDMDNNLKL